MAMWGTRILSAFLAFTLGVYSTGIVRYAVAAADKVRTVYAAGKSQMLPLLKLNVADHQSSHDAADVMQPHPVSLSPYQIKLLIDQNSKSEQKEKEYDLDFESIWSQLDIRPNVYTKLDHADISRFQLDNELGAETVLRLCADTGWQSIYLIFKKSATHLNANGGWTLLGYIDAFTWIDSPQIRVVSIGTNHWLVVRHCAGHGSGGYYREDDDWYGVSDNGVIPVLSYYNILSGGMNPNSERDTKIQLLGFRDGVATVVLQVSNAYKGYTEHYESIPLWKDTRRVTFVRTLGTSAFVPDFPHSELSEEEICDLSDSDELCGSVDYSTTSFLQYNYLELTRIAAKGKRKQREWLRNFLNDCDDSLEKQSLQNALGETRP